MEKNTFKRFFSLELLKKNLPFILLLILTIFLMIIFRHNKKAIAGIIEEGKRNLLSLYTNSLHPLISKTEISEEDLFNFALYQSLPLDKQRNKVLLLSNNNGEQVYEIKSAVYNQKTSNYDSFVKLLGMNDRQKNQTDSILNSYRKDIYSCVLLNDKDAYAINPKIAKVQQAMLVDLITLANKVDAEKAKKIFTTTQKFDEQKIASLMHSAKEPASPEYFLMTPDTVAKTDFSWDQNKFEKQLKEYEMGKMAVSDFARDHAYKWENNLDKKGKVEVRVGHPGYNYRIDSNRYKISVTGSQLSKMINDSLRQALEMVSKKLRSISIRIPKVGRRGSNVSITPPIPDIPGVAIGAEMAEKAMKMVGDLNIPALIAEAMKHDKEFQSMMKDSVKFKKAKEKMREANRKLKKYGMDTLNY